MKGEETKTPSSDISAASAAAVGENEDADSMECEYEYDYDDAYAVEDDDEEDDDDALRRAIEMSVSDVKNSNKNDSTANEGTPGKMEPPEEVDYSSEVKRGESNIGLFHKLMWDPTITTRGDMERWLGQGIMTPLLSGSSNLVENENDSNSSDPLNFVSDQSKSSWGLVQAHGGPCGVLAAVQAELIRILAFGRRPHSRLLSYPISLDSAKLPDTTLTLDPDIIREGLAMSIGIVLSRAALAPSAAEDEQKGTRKRPDNAALPLVRLAFPSTQNPTNDSAKLDATQWNGLNWSDLAPWPSESSTSSDITRFLDIHTVSLRTAKTSSSSSGDQSKNNQDVLDLAMAVSRYLLKHNHLMEYFHKPGGVILLVMSLVECRGEDTVRSDMDDPVSTRLTSQFGHCSQELINLLLTGQAVSNVFDSMMTVSGALTCRGVQYRPDVGYLSQLEALRYCEVGSYYKSPKYPVWVVGSTSHFSVLFGNARCLQESQSDVLLERCRRAFKSVEGGEENGFIQAGSLGIVLKALDLHEKVDGDNGTQTLAAALEVSGAGIILWDDFWKASSRLLTGASLQSVLQGDDGTSKVGTGPMAASGDQHQPPLLLTEFGEPGTKPTTVTEQALISSDEELARKLEAEWANSDGQSNGSVDAVATVSNPPSLDLSSHASTAQGRAKTDEELARELNERWNGGTESLDEHQMNPILFSEVGTLPRKKGSNNDAVNGMVVVTETSNVAQLSASNDARDDEDVASGAKGDDISKDTAMLPKEDSKPSAQVDNAKSASQTHQSNKQNQKKETFDFEKFGDTFKLYHYNGLRGGCLTTFRVTRLSPEEAVGASIALSRSSGGHGAVPGQGGLGNSTGGGGDLEDIVRTKWPSCVFDWGGKHPPYVD